jgi:hypothetical protein
MSAVPSDSPNRRRDPITLFRERYAEALAEVRVSVAHTETEGWQKLYAGFRKEEQERRRKQCGELKRLAGLMEDAGLSEDDEKELAAVKKASESIREAREAFEARTITPVRKPVAECERVMDEARNMARREESSAPLHNTGLEKLMKLAISEVEKPRWDNETGRVLIMPPSGEGN